MNDADLNRLAIDHDFVPVVRRLLADTLTPVTAFQRLDDGESAFLIESVTGGENVGRYSFLGSTPVRRMTAAGGESTIESGLAKETLGGDPFDVLRQQTSFRVAAVPGLPPLIGGAIGYIAYDAARYVEHLPDAPPDDRGLPDIDVGFYHELCVFDHVDRTITVVALADCRDVADAGSAAAALRAATAAADGIVTRLTTSHRETMQTFDPDGWRDARSRSMADEVSNMTRPQYCDAVRRCVEYIRAGDIFQVVPSQRLRITSTADPFSVYRSLRVVNPSPFMFFVRSPSCVLVGCSPEIMCRVKDRQVTVRPLAGTRPRGATRSEDLKLERELLADPKELAEHVMLVDLGRNDVGRIAKFGSVELTEQMTVERYSHVMHISSEVQGRLRDDLDAIDALCASLPAGTVSGAPKIRAMQIIDEIEPTRRGPYAGAIGYLDYRGNVDTCLGLRTIVYADGHYDVQAGAGVVADSDPETEYQETLNKAGALVAAIRWTERRSVG